MDVSLEVADGEGVVVVGPSELGQNNPAEARSRASNGLIPAKSGSTDGRLRSQGETPCPRISVESASYSGPRAVATS